MRNTLRLVTGLKAKNVWIGLALGTLFACGDPQEDLPLAHPLSRRLTYFKTQETFIVAAPGVPLDDLCDLKGFGDLRPGMSAEEVSRIYGLPVSKYQERQGRRTVYVFPVEPNASVEVVWQMVGSEDPLVELWTLRHSVEGKRFEEIIAPEVVAAIPLSQRGFTLHLSSEEAGATIKFRAGRPHTLWWVDDGRDDSVGQ